MHRGKKFSIASYTLGHGGGGAILTCVIALHKIILASLLVAIGKCSVIVNLIQLAIAKS